TLTSNNPLVVLYVDHPSTELVDQIIQGSHRLTAAQVPEFVELAATILKNYKAQEDNNQDADAVCTLASYVQLPLYDDKVQRLVTSDVASLEVQYHGLNVIRHICEDNIDKHDQLKIRTDLQTVLL
ncbi:unnamed protein product, partial [Rotaria sp. Silwood2]